jgi:aminoglycoside phosphotransferase (APT) family kinase protein
LIGQDLAALGVPTEAEILAAYCARRSLPIPSPDVFRFYLAFAMFRIAAIAAGIDARLRQGNASSESASDVAAQIETFADGGAALARQTESK